MKKLTPKQLREKLTEILRIHSGIQISHVKFAMLLGELHEMPEGHYTGAYWEPGLGVIVYSSNADAEFWDKYSPQAVCAFRNKSPASYKRATEKKTGRGRPRKDYSGEYTQMRELREQGYTVRRIAEAMDKTEYYIYRLEARYQAQINNEMC